MSRSRQNEMKRYLLPLIFLLVAVASAQGQQFRIGEIEFYGAAGVDLEKVRAALPFREGDTLSKETGAQEKFERAKQIIKQLTGRTPTEVGPVCCDTRGGMIIFIGLSGQPMRYSTAPKGKARFPASVNKLYDEWWNALTEGTRQGKSSEDWSQGYALSKDYPPLRAIQLRMRAYALRQNALIRGVLETAGDDDQRAKAAELLGYARSSAAQLAALVRACRDSNDDVRNNATRALVVLITSKPELARRIQPDVSVWQPQPPREGSIAVAPIAPTPVESSISISIRRTPDRSRRRSRHGSRSRPQRSRSSRFTTPTASSSWERFQSATRSSGRSRLRSAPTDR